MNVVVVESPAKAKTINKYLGRDFTVLASYGHVRDLPSKDGSVEPDRDFAMAWSVDDRARRHLGEIRQALKGAKKLYLATDPDREGEAISWHVREVLKDQGALDDVEVSRVVFHEITKDAVLDAMRHPRELDGELIDAYLARRALDYLVGFTLSPVLWRKLPGSRSAGRVQSVALRLICEREAEIEAFRAREYWTVDALFATAKGETLRARLTHLDGRKLDKLDLGDEAAARAAVQAIEAGRHTVKSVERKETRRHPAAPFTTSTLQQEAARKLHYSARRTMQIAQRLYEGVDLDGETVGLITYMRTDAVTLSNEAIGSARQHIQSAFGADYLPGQPRLYKTKSKNAQEAHEAIRPTDIRRTPASVARHLDADQLRLYELIWKRTVACQMESARLDQATVDVVDAGGRSQLRATGSVVVFDGFLKLYQEGVDDSDDDEGSARLPAVKAGDALERRQVTPEQHFTQPPPRYSEASLVKSLEELGIGRPSTYASIISVLQERNYVRLEKRRFVPEDRGRLVTAFLTRFFRRYVEYGFTAELEDELDEISNGHIAWRDVLRRFWTAFHDAVEQTTELRVRDVLDAMDEILGPHFFPDDGTGNARACPDCKEGRLSLKLGKFGPFVGCSNYPECRYTRQLVAPGQDGEDVNALPRALGEDPASGQPVSVRRGPYGVYVQLGDGDKENKPKRSSLPKGVDAQSITLEQALSFLSLPRLVGKHPETGHDITAGLGRFGPYLKHGQQYVSLKEDDVLTVGLNRAVTLIAQTPDRSGRAIGEHPKDGKPVRVRPGRYGAYVQHGTVRATIPKGEDAEAITLARALELLAAKAPAKGKGAAAKSAKAKAADTANGKAPTPGAKADGKPRAKAKPKAKAKAKTKAKAKSKAKGKTAPAPTAQTERSGAGDGPTER